MVRRYAFSRRRMIARTVVSSSRVRVDAFVVVTPRERRREVHHVWTDGHCQLWPAAKVFWRRIRDSGVCDLDVPLVGCDLVGFVGEPATREDLEEGRRFEAVDQEERLVF